jgi:hypothetical protein
VLKKMREHASYSFRQSKFSLGLKRTWQIASFI